jgi:hypothetical protein
MISVQLIVVLLFLPNANFILFFKNDDELHVHHHFLYKVTQKQKLDNDNEHIAHRCPLLFLKWKTRRSCALVVVFSAKVHKDKKKDIAEHMAHHCPLFQEISFLKNNKMT